MLYFAAFFTASTKELLLGLAFFTASTKELLLGLAFFVIKMGWDANLVQEFLP